MNTPTKSKHLSEAVEGKSVIAVVVPCYRVVDYVLDVLKEIPAIVDVVYCVDDGCDSDSGNLIRTRCNDPRVRVLHREQNGGVGAAMITGYRAALADGATVIVKIDGDGQMDPALIPKFISPIIRGECDYTKGNRFYEPEGLTSMPLLRLVGNAGLSFMTKFSSGYWQIFDPTNGYTAIHAEVLRGLPLAKVDNSYFFESDLLFRLNIHRAVVLDVPMHARYENERSSLKPLRLAPIFFYKHIRNLSKRIIYNYFVRDFNVASLELVVGLPLLLGGSGFGLYSWFTGLGAPGTPAPAGTVMLAALPVILGAQLLLGFLQFDATSPPKRPLHPDLIADRD